MDLLDHLLAHDTWTTRQLLLTCRRFTDELLDREFQIDHNSLRETFIHMIDNLEVWINLLYERPMQEGTGISIDQLSECPSLASREFSKLAYKISHEGRFDDSLLNTLDKPPYLKTYGGTIGHVITYNMHHRTHSMFLMEKS